MQIRLDRNKQKCIQVCLAESNFSLEGLHIRLSADLQILRHLALFSPCRANSEIEYKSEDRPRKALYQFDEIQLDESPSKIKIIQIIHLQHTISTR